jgi:uncharacterized membrane protein
MFGSGSKEGLQIKEYFVGEVLLIVKMGLLIMLFW